MLSWVECGESLCAACSLILIAQLARAAFFMLNRSKPDHFSKQHKGESGSLFMYN